MVNIPSRRSRRPVPRYLPSFEVMEAREMLSASPASLPGAGRASSTVPDVVSIHDRRAPLVAVPDARSTVAARPLSDALLDRQYVLAIRARDVKGFRSMLATVRATDRRAWRGIVRAMDAGSPAAWSLLLSALRTHFPGVPGVPPRAPGQVAAPMSTPPSLALPLGPNFDLGTRWSLVHTDNPSTYRSPALVAMSADSTVWAVFPNDPSTLYQYDPQGQAWYGVWQAPGNINSISAGASDPSTGRMVGVSYTQNGQAYVAMLQGASPYGSYMQVSFVTPVMGNPSYAQIASEKVGPYQFVWVLSNNNIVRYNPDYATVPTGQLKPLQIAVVSQDQLWMVATSPSNPTPAPYVLADGVNGSWMPGPALPGLTSLAGTADGTLWAEDSGGNLYTLSPDGSKWLQVTSVSAVSNQAPTTTPVTLPSGYGAFAAGSKYRAAAADPYGGVQILTYGLADQPALGYPTMDPGQQAGYNYINQYFGITAAGGIRSLYPVTADVNNLSGYQGQLLTWSKATSVPQGLSISLSDWQSIATEVYNEVYSVVAVDGYFTNDIIPLTNQLSSEVPALLSSTSQQVQLSTSQQGSLFSVIFNQIFSAALGGIVKAFSGGAGVAASLIASGINAAIADATGNKSNSSYALNYYELSSAMSSIFPNANATNAALQSAILSDPNRFLPFGPAVRSNAIGWPVETSEQIAGTTLNAFQRYFLQSLAPLAWPIYYATGYPADSVQGCWPSYTSYFQPDSNGDGYGTIYVLGTPGTFGFNFPDQSLNLVPTILQVTGATQAQLLSNQLGWFQTVQRSAEFMLIYCAGPPPASTGGSTMT